MGTASCECCNPQSCAEKKVLGFPLVCPSPFLSHILVCTSSCSDSPWYKALISSPSFPFSSSLSSFFPHSFLLCLNRFNLEEWYCSCKWSCSLIVCTLVSYLPLWLHHEKQHKYMDFGARHFYIQILALLFILAEWPAHFASTPSECFPHPWKGKQNLPIVFFKNVF